MVDRKELGQTEAPDELIPGKTEPLFQNAQALRDRATDVIADGEALKRIDTGGWTGPAHDAYAEESANQWPKWLKLGDALAYGAQAVESYANCLGWAQMQAAHAVELYRRGEQLHQQAVAAHDKAVADATAQSQANAQHGGPPVQAPAFHDPGEEYKHAAHDILNRARTQLETVAGESAKALNEMAEAVPTEDEESTAETITHAAADLLGFVPVFGDAVDLAHAGVYALQGKGVDAGLTAAAAVPFIGWGAGAGKLGKAGGKIGKALEKGESARFGWSTRVGKQAYRHNFFDAYPELRGQVQVHHAVEQRVRNIYPHLDISPNEMHSLDNLRGIPKELAPEYHQGKLQKEWNRFYKANPNPTRQDLLDHATKMDDKYGHMFIPPVRQGPP